MGLGVTAVTVLPYAGVKPYRIVLSKPRQSNETAVWPMKVQWISSAAVPVGAGLTVTTRVSGVASGAPNPSVTVNVTLYVPGVLKMVGPGSSAVEFVAPPPKFHA